MLMSVIRSVLVGLLIGAMYVGLVKMNRRQCKQYLTLAQTRSDSLVVASGNKCLFWRPKF